MLNRSTYPALTRLLRRHQCDSIAHATMSQMGGPAQGMIMGTSVQSVGDERYQVLKGIPTKNRLTLIDGVGGKRYLVEEAMPTIEWTLTEGNSTIAKYMPEGHRQVARQDVDGAPHG